MLTLNYSHGLAIVSFPSNKHSHVGQDMNDFEDLTGKSEISFLPEDNYKLVTGAVEVH